MKPDLRATILRNPLVFTGIFIVLPFMLGGWMAPLIAPHDPLAVNFEKRLVGPDADYPFGTDELGRCVLSRLIYGARISMALSIKMILVITGIGFLVGISSGLAGGWFDFAVMRLLDCVLGFPSLVLALAITGFLGPSLDAVCIGITAGWWTIYARLIRGLVAVGKRREFVEAAEVIGTSGFALVWRHILPQVLPPVLVLASLDAGWIILSLSGLSFLGLGAQPPTPEWGTMLNDAAGYMRAAPLQMIACGATITMAVMGFNLLGEGLRDVLQVKEPARW